MTEDVGTWLPFEGAVSEAVAVRAGEAIGEWGKAWFAKGAVHLSSIKSTKPDSDNPAGRRGYSGGLAIDCSQAGVAKLVNRALDIRSDLAIPTGRDSELLRLFGEALLEDLAARLKAALGSKQGSGAAPTDSTASSRLNGLSIIVGDDRGSDLLSVDVPAVALIRFCRAAYPPAASRIESMTPLAQAAGEATVAVEAVLGLAEVPLEALRGLSAGDVIVLDRHTDEPLEVGALGGVAFARARLTPIDGHVGLAFQD